MVSPFHFVQFLHGSSRHNWSISLVTSQVIIPIKTLVVWSTLVVNIYRMQSEHIRNKSEIKQQDWDGPYQWALVPYELVVDWPCVINREDQPWLDHCRCSLTMAGCSPRLQAEADVPKGVLDVGLLWPGDTGAWEDGCQVKPNLVMIVIMIFACIISIICQFFYLPISIYH